MTVPPPWITALEDGVQVAVKLTPRSRKNCIEPVGPSDLELKIRLIAPPVDNAANAALIQFLAETFHCPKNRVHLVRGQKSRHKLVRIEGANAKRILESV